MTNPTVSIAPYALIPILSLTNTKSPFPHPCRVKQYEGKLATLSVFNDALQKENQQLRDAVEQNGAPVSATDQEVAELKQEFSKRMAAQQKEVSRLKAKLEEARASGQGGTSAQARLRDREGYITSLQVLNQPNRPCRTLFPHSSIYRHAQGQRLQHGSILSQY